MSDAKIAIIDDETQILTMLDRYLSKNGYKIATFSDSIQGMNSALSNEYDIILLDIMMPKMDGIEVLDRIKEKKPDARVIMMTAYSTLDKVLKTHKIGANNYIMKPFESLSVLTDKIEAVLSEK